MKLYGTRRTTLFLTSCGLATMAIVGPLAGAASAATSPAFSYNSYDGTFSGSGFTPGGLVYVQEQEGATVIGSITARASSPKVRCYYIREDHTWECVTTSDGGTIAGTLSPDPAASLSCAVIVNGTVSATDETTGSIASVPVTWEGMC